MSSITLAFAPTRRSIFSAPAAVEYADKTRRKLREMEVSFFLIPISERSMSVRGLQKN